ncbi:MAG: hypothetical protein NTX44_15310 [Ignavibacteriales bacterium]|nr:hypothetical protein [Ignavibacteriales bacterium]
MKSIFFILIPIFISCSHSTTPPEMRDFNFKFSYGVNERNIINTFQNTYTKDLISDGDTTVPFTLSANDLKQILDKMNEIGFFEYPDTFIVPTEGPVTIVRPFSIYRFDVCAKVSKKHLYWKDEIKNENAQATKLRELNALIIGIIQSKPEYSQLPLASGGYL